MERFITGDKFKDYCGVYKIQSIIKPQRIYVGSAINIRIRWNIHSSGLKLNKHENPKLQNHVNKYGIDDLIFSIIIICDKEELIPINGIIRPEQFFIWAYNPYFNINPIAGSPLGSKRSDVSKRKMSLAQTGKKLSEECKSKLSEIGRGHFVSEETKKKISEKVKGFIHTKEARKKMSELKRGKRHPIYGKHHSESTKRKMRIPHGPMTEEHRKNLSISHMGHTPWNKGKTGVYSDAIIQKMRDGRRGKNKKHGK